MRPQTVVTDRETVARRHQPGGERIGTMALPVALGKR